MAGPGAAAVVTNGSRGAVPDGRAGRGTPRWWRGYRYWAFQYRRTWRGSVATSFLVPVLYLAGMGLGLGSLVDHHVHRVDGVRYLDFIAPGLLAATAMQIGAADAMYPVMGAIKWWRTYTAMLATPLRVADVLLGHLAWMATRVAIVAGAYLVVLAAFGAAVSPLAVLALPAAVLTGLAFAAPVAAFSATQDKDLAFTTIYRFAIVPLFLFSGTFYPVDRLPAWLRPVAQVTPLYRGVDLCRGLCLGTLRAVPAVLDVAELVGLVAVGVAVGLRTYTRRLAP